MQAHIYMIIHVHPRENGPGPEPGLNATYMTVHTCMHADAHIHAHARLYIGPGLGLAQVLESKFMCIFLGDVFGMCTKLNTMANSSCSLDMLPSRAPQ